jgi:hypothetical protein
VGPEGFSQTAQPATAAIETTAKTATLGHNHFLLDCNGIGTLLLVLPTWGASRSIISSIGFKSRADCQRSSGFFSRHLLAKRSSCRGTAG